MPKKISMKACQFVTQESRIDMQGPYTSPMTMHTICKYIGQLNLPKTAVPKLCLLTIIESRRSDNEYPTIETKQNKDGCDTGTWDADFSYFIRDWFWILKVRYNARRGTGSGCIWKTRHFIRYRTWTTMIRYRGSRNKNKSSASRQGQQGISIYGERHLYLFSRAPRSQAPNPIKPWGRWTILFLRPTNLSAGFRSKHISLVCDANELIRDSLIFPLFLFIGHIKFSELAITSFVINQPPYEVGSSSILSTVLWVMDSQPRSLK
jgi:hypothetical protein